MLALLFSLRWVVLWLVFALSSILVGLSIWCWGSCAVAGVFSALFCLGGGFLGLGCGCVGGLLCFSFAFISYTVPFGSSLL